LRTFLQIQRAPTAKAAERIVAKKVGKTTHVGFCEPKSARIPITVKGINWILAVLMTMKSIISEVIFSDSLFKDCRSCMAWIPRGVAAFPKPKRLARKFKVMEAIEG
jgi:hypothetical protein